MAARHGEHTKRGAKVHWQDPTSTREYWCSGCEDESAAAVELEIGVAVPLAHTVNGVSRFFDGIVFKEGTGGGGNWDATVTYSKSADLKQHSFDIGVSNTKMLEALELVASYDCSDPPVDPDAPQPGIPDFGKAINVHDNTVSGVDVEIGRFEFQIERLFSFAALAATPFFLKTIRDMTPSVNSADYTLKWNSQLLPCSAGELRFRGGTAKQIALDGLHITYKFSFSKNITDADNITIGNSYKINKRGHDYIWPYYESVINSTTNRRVQRPRSAYVVRVYNYADFTALGIDE